MTDGIISGAGTSRNFKVPANAKAMYPTWDAALDAMIAGTFTFDLYGINPAGWDVVGDKIGKETLLTDALCSALGLPTTATPTQAMDKLRQLVDTAQSGVDNGVKIATGSYSGNNSYSFTLYFPFYPKICIIQCESDVYSAIFLHGSSKGRPIAGQDVQLSWGSTNLTITQKSTSYAPGLNLSGFNYLYMIIS